MGRNRLAEERSPYLLLHADDPVDWRPWGDAALEEARQAGKPIFLSIGYSTCHWCHVMHRESFLDADVARWLNEHFIPIKVDREEHPDVDEFYMTAVQAMTGEGGWPLTVFLTPEGLPFYGGTYFPKTRRFGRIGLLELLPRIVELWRTRPEDVRQVAENARRGLRSLFAFEARPFEEGLVDEAYRALRREYDPVHGGFGTAPKFPLAHRLLFLLRYGAEKKEPEATAMAAESLRKMAAGAIRDHLGGGWMRYATDRAWRVPHFEKMLYDQALLLYALAEAAAATGEATFRDLAEETVAYVFERLGAPEGAFYTAEDADVDGVEGAYYLFTPEEVRAVLGEEDGALFSAAYDIGSPGPIEGKSAPNLTRFEPKALQDRFGMSEAALFQRLEAARKRLRAYREARHRLFVDRKILSGPNGLMIAALARAGELLGRPAWVARAEAAYRFVRERLIGGDGTLYVRYIDGERKNIATLDDVAALAWGALELFFAAQAPAYLEEARRWVAYADARFRAPEGGYRHTAAAGPGGVSVRKAADGAIPSGNAVLAFVRAHFARLLGRPEDAEALEALFTAFGGRAFARPAEHAFLLAARLVVEGSGAEVVIVGEREHPATAALVRATREGYRPHTLVLVRPPAGPEAEAWDRALPDTAAMRPVGGRPAAYVCRRMVCRAPVTDPDALRAALAEAT
ncbi:thioredoxin domain-containing protein [Hydrogenibacillus sp. N12]|uniref:thioredoxin domain-containing protein n=1 Tax=Hydrogenibacillus sp. N12 TaxID=2866627 RepID=UPI001C7D4AEC|nr:thioredoxin domain-containing protein [Hydrogenibacillus sp. N12]QZA33610.1 thioredoxin domain-containing protein [Hydrogenibacillus sp. N12]